MDYDDLAALLHRRLLLIGDHEFRDRDPDAHLRELKSASEAIAAWHERHRAEIPPRLEHFLANCSYDKALRFAESGGTWAGH